MTTRPVALPKFGKATGRVVMELRERLKLILLLGHQFNESMNHHHEITTRILELKTPLP